MLQLVLCSCDANISPALAPALGVEFRLAVDMGRDRIRDLVARGKCDIVVLDLETGDIGEMLAFLDDLRRIGIPVVALSGADRRVAIELARRDFAYHCKKPLVVAELMTLIRRAYEAAALKREVAAFRSDAATPAEQCGELVGSAPTSEAIYNFIRRVAPLDVFVLITGESGTGKELIARAIHACSERKANRFVAVSCGAIPESLIEAELFGSEKGAYTGSLARRTGYFEDAGEGTLLLDEIGELSNHTQVKLLRVLQQREFTRLGSSTPIPLRARMLFATHRNLKRMVEEGSFRQDLYFRLNVVAVQSQPLRERREDIPVLARHFLSKYAPIYRKSVVGIKPEAMTVLQNYQWPGNVRELENVIQSAIILCDNESIGVASLPEDVQCEAAVKEKDALPWTSFEDQLRDYKTKLAVAAIRECKGNKTMAAQSLNISRAYLHRLIREPIDEGPDLQVA